MNGSPYTELVIGTEPGTYASVAIDTATRARHLYVIGQTGTGKSTLLECLVAQDLAAGSGLALLDPHGDLSLKVLSHLPHRRAAELILLDPTDRDRPVSFNPLDGVAAQDRHRTADNIVHAFMHAFGDSAVGPQSQMLLRQSVRALMDAGRSSLLCIPRLIDDADYRAIVVNRVRDPYVRRYWTTTFAGYDERQRLLIIAPLQNKLDAFLSSADIRSVIGQPTSSIDLRRIMDEGRVLIVRLPRGTLGESYTYLLGSLIMISITNAALARADLPEPQRRPFYLYVDEVQCFPAGGLDTILSETRKFGLFATVGNQFLSQLDIVPGLRQALFGNVGSIIAFRVGIDDAEPIARQIGLGLIEQGTHRFLPDLPQLLALPNYHAIGRFIVENRPTPPLDIVMQPAPPAINRRPHRAIRRSRDRYGRDRQRVEAAFARFLSRRDRSA